MAAEELGVLPPFFGRFHGAVAGGVLFEHQHLVPQLLQHRPHLAPRRGLERGGKETTVPEKHGKG